MALCKHSDAGSKLCQLSAMLEVDKSKPSVKVPMPSNKDGLKSQWCWPTKPAKHGLCYFHDKLERGLFGVRKTAVWL